MKDNQLKALLHEGIENIEDEEFLLALKNIIDRKYMPAQQPDLSPEQVQRIEESKSQINQGKFLSNEEADKLVDEWLSE